MSSRARKSQRLSHQDSSESTSKHARSPSENPEYQQLSTEQVPEKDGQVDHTDQDFTVIGVAAYLHVDPRPTFVLNVEANLNEALEPVFLNDSLSSDHQLLKLLPFKSKSDSPRSPSKLPGSNFKLWIKDLAQLENSQLSCSYCGITWTGFIVSRRWIVISGECANLSTPANLPVRSESPTNTMTVHTTGARIEMLKDGQPRPRRTLTSTENDSSLLSRTVQLETSYVTPGTPDWTVKSPEGELSPHAIFARSVDWSSTPLGDMSIWSREFRQIACLLMANPHPAALFWGEELTVIYNKPYADQVAGEKHPKLMGTGFRGPFAEIWDFVGPMFRECRRTGQSVAASDQMLPIERHGFLEETFYTVWHLSYRCSSFDFSNNS
jgi:hypothetical protein